MPYADPQKRKECASRAAKRYYEKNKEAVKARTKATKDANKVKWAEYKSTLSCAFCGYNSCVDALEFHHVIRRPDNEKVYKLAANNSYNKLWEEIKKCVVLCANCHRYAHWLEKNGTDKDLHEMQERFKSLIISD